MVAGVLGIVVGSAYLFIRMLAQPTGMDFPALILGALLVGAFAAIFILPSMLVLGWPIAAISIARRWPTIVVIGLTVLAALAALTGIYFLLELDSGPAGMPQDPSFVSVLLNGAAPFAIATAAGLVWRIGREQRRTAIADPSGAMPPAPRSE